jgi:hypothetical protein
MEMVRMITEEQRASSCAAILLLHREFVDNGKECPQITAKILALTGATEAQAREALVDLRKQPSDLGEISSQAGKTVLEALYEYTLYHPCVGYALTDEIDPAGHDHYCKFVISLVAPGEPAENWTPEDLASRAHIPLGALKKKLRELVQELFPAGPPGAAL